MNLFRIFPFLLVLSFTALTSPGQTQSTSSTDLELVEVLLPESSSTCNISDIVRIRIANIGPYPAINFELMYSYTNNYQNGLVSDTIVETVGDTLFAGDTLDYTFVQLTGLSSISIMGIYLNFSVDYFLDSNSSNNVDSFMIIGPELHMHDLGEPNQGSLNFELLAFASRDHLFTIEEGVAEATISLCGSSFDTELSIHKCTEVNPTYPLYYSNDYCGDQSQITMINPEPGRYFANVSGDLPWSYGPYVISYSTKVRQQIDLASGWDLISSYITPDSLNMEQVFGPIFNHIIIVKDGDGNVFWPQFGVNMIGDFSNYKGYQVKSSSQAILELTGSQVFTDTCHINIPSGWSIIPYLKNQPGSIDLMLQSINSSILIVKSWNGSVYWPQFNLNLIQQMNPGEAYQLKSSQADTLIYETAN